MNEPNELHDLTARDADRPLTEATAAPAPDDPPPVPLDQASPDTPPSPIETAPEFGESAESSANLEWTEAQANEWKAKAAKADENWDRFLRLTADFENFKKRSARDRQDAIRFANEGLILKLLPILDNFEMALSVADSLPDGAEAFKTGVSMIHTQFKTALRELGVEEIVAAGQPFDPNWHEAVSQQETSEVEEGHVAQQLRKGYKLRERLLRPASVVVAKKPGAQ